VVPGIFEHHRKYVGDQKRIFGNDIQSHLEVHFRYTDRLLVKCVAPTPCEALQLGDGSWGLRAGPRTTEMIAETQVVRERGQIKNRVNCYFHLPG
jgi:hypothetical protein